MSRLPLRTVEDAPAEAKERLAAAELEAKDNHLANQRISSYMRTLKLRNNQP